VTAYLIRRSLTAIVVLFGVSIFIFFMLHVIYPTPAIDVLGPHANKFSIAQWNSQHGFDDPWIVQYLHYLNQLLHGNLGYSYKLNQSVAALFGERWMRSAYLSGVTLFLSVLIAIPLGIYQAIRRNTFGDAVVTTGAFVTYAMPDFFLYLIAIQLFAITFPIFSYEGPQTTSMISIITDWRAMTLPIVCLTLLELAGYLICEAVFNFPGLGLLFYDALGTADYPILLAYTLVGAVLVIAGNFIADIALTVADPRIRLV